MIGRISKPFADLQDRRRQLAQRVLLLADDAFALLDEADRDGVRDPVRRGLVGVENAVEQVEVVAVLLEQRPGQDVAQQQDDPDDLVGLDPPRDDPLGQVAGVMAQLLDAPGLQDLDVVVVHGSGLGEDLLLGHRRQQVRVVDPAAPTPRAVSVRFSLQVRDELRKQARSSSPGSVPSSSRCASSSRHVLPSLVVGGSRSPFGHRDRRALADLGHDVELVHQPAGTRQPQPEPAVGAVAVLQRRRRSGIPVRCPAPRPSSPSDRPRRPRRRRSRRAARTSRCCGRSPRSPWRSR